MFSQRNIPNMSGRSYQRIVSAASIWPKLFADVPWCLHAMTTATTSSARITTQACSCSKSRPVQSQLPPLQATHTHATGPHQSRPVLKPTWKERCALDEAQRALFREGPSRAAELRKSCAAQIKTWKRRKRGRGKGDKKHEPWLVNEWGGKLATSCHLTIINNWVTGAF